MLITLAAAYARGGRLDDARAAIEQSIRLPSSDPSFAAIRMGGGRISETRRTIAFLSDALRQAGLPEWPLRFPRSGGASGWKGDEIIPLTSTTRCRASWTQANGQASCRCGPTGRQRSGASEFRYRHDVRPQ